jgi:hypothetical protein
MLTLERYMSIADVAEDGTSLETRHPSGIDRTVIRQLFQVDTKLLSCVLMLVANIYSYDERKEAPIYKRSAKSVATKDG